MRIYSIICALFLSCFAVSSPALADYEEGVNAAFAGDFETALREFTLAAENGLDLAQYNLAILYFTGQGVDQDLSKAFYWTEAAAQQGHVNAQFNLGSLYMSGQGIQQNADEGVVWFARAAKAGHADAAFALASLYEAGDSVARDGVSAHAWANQAVYNEHSEAEDLLKQIEERLNADQLSQARRLFARWQIEP